MSRVEDKRIKGFLKMTKAIRQHLATAYQVPYLVSWFDGENSTSTAQIVRADKDFSNTFADTPRTISFPNFMIDEIGSIDLIEQYLASVAPVNRAAIDPALLIHSQNSGA